MSIYDNAGVALIPSGTKASKLYSVLPANGDGDFTHSRGSTATRVNKDGFIESVATNVPRLDYPLIDGVVQDCPALLLEPSRSNNLPYAEQFDNAAWTKSNSSVTANQAISPDGSQTADLLELTSAGGSIYDGVGGSGDYAFSVFAKYVDAQYIRLRSTGSYAYFDIQNGSVGSTINVSSTKIEDYGNGWYRCTVVGNNTNSLAQIFVSDTDGSNTGTGSVYIWGAMFEAGSYATSYIPTSGSTATRSADVCNGSGTSAEFNDSEGVLFAEIAFAESQSSSSHRISLSNGTTSYRMIIQQNNNATPNRLQFYFIVTLSAQTSFQHTLTDITQFNKIAFKYKENDFAVWVNGIEVLTDTSGVTFPEGTVNQLNFDDGVGGNDFYGNTKQLMTFKTALTDSELETLTSWDSFNAMAKGQLYTIE